MPHHWQRDDEVIAIGAYFRIQDGESNDIAVNRAVSLVNRRAQRDDNPPFNNYGSMRMRIQNVQFLSTNGAIGLRNVARQTADVWEQYGNNRDDLQEEMDRIIATLPQ